MILTLIWALKFDQFVPFSPFFNLINIPPSADEYPQNRWPLKFQVLQSRGQPIFGTIADCWTTDRITCLGSTVPVN